MTDSTNGPSGSTDFVMVPVPRDLYGVVVAALAKAQAEASASPPGGGGQPAATDTAWTAEEIRRLADTINSTGKALMDLCSERPGELISFGEVMERAGLSSDSARGGLAGLTRHVKKHHGHNTWPGKNTWGEEVGRDAQMYYSVTPEVAEWWMAATR